MGDGDKERSSVVAETTRELKRAQETIRFVRAVVLWPNVLGLGFTTALAVGRLADLGHDVGIQVAVVAALGGMTIAAAAGLVLVFHQPFKVTLCLALVQTLAASMAWAHHLADAGSPPWVVTPWIGSFWTALIWLATLRLASVRQLYREHPGPDLARKMQAMFAGHTRRASLDALTAEDIRSHDRRRALAIAAALLTLTATAGLVVHSRRLPELDRPCAAFVEAWNTADLEALATLLPEHDRTGRMADIVQLMETRGWLERHPRIVDAAVRNRAVAAPVDVRFPLENGRQLSVTWAVTGNQWSVENLVFPHR